MPVGIMPERPPVKFAVLSTIVFLAALVTAMGRFISLPWLSIGALMFLFVTAASVAWRNRGRTRDVAISWALSFVAWVSVLVGNHGKFVPDEYFGTMAGAAALAALLVALRLPPGITRTQFCLLSLTWGYTMGLVWLAAGYFYNLPASFYVGVFMFVALLGVMKLTFKLPPLGVQLANTMILLFLGLPLADLLVRPSYQLGPRPDARARLYSYAEARKDPRAFARWWYYFCIEWRKTTRAIAMHDTNGIVPFRLRRGIDGTLFDSRIHINQHGFRGPDFPAEKGGAYRILALGESTTFGITLCEEDIPWPDLLQRRIVERFNPDRPVQVINAGIPSYTLQMNLERLHRRLLSFQPDLIISYHGKNGFDWLIPSIPPVTGAPLPHYQARPVKLLGDVEYRAKILLYRWNRIQPSPRSDPEIHLGDNPYAHAYRELIGLARSNNLHLVMANYSMAVNTNSDIDVIGFYRAAFPEVQQTIRANELHTQLVRQLAKENPDVIFVDTHPRLDGQHDKFIDLVHFTQEGRDDMAEMMFNAIRPVLEQEFGKSAEDKAARTEPGLPGG
jgi:lysophospholipase L1-like esterase